MEEAAGALRALLEGARAAAAKAAEAAALTHPVATGERLEAEAQLVAVKQKARAQVANLKEQNSDLRAQLAAKDVEAKEAQNSELKAQLAAKEVEVSDLNTQNSDLKARLGFDDALLAASRTGSEIAAELAPADPKLRIGAIELPSPAPRAMRAIQGAQRAAADIGQRFVDGVDFYRSGVALLGDDVSYAVGLVLKVRESRGEKTFSSLVENVPSR